MKNSQLPLSVQLFVLACKLLIVATLFWVLLEICAFTSVQSPIDWWSLAIHLISDATYLMLYFKVVRPLKSINTST